MSDVAQWIGSPEIDDGVVALVVVVEPPRAAGDGRCSVGTIVSAQHRSDIHRFSNCKYLCPPKLQKKRKIGGEGKESNLPST